MPANARRLDLVPEPDEDPDAEAAAALRASLIQSRERDRSELATVTIERRQVAATCDPEGKYLRDEAGKLIPGPLVLFFRRLNSETVTKLRREHSRRVPVRRQGVTVYEDQLDDDYVVAYLYGSLLPWCRARYFDDQQLWGQEPVGTGLEYFRVYLSEAELNVAQEAVMLLQHGDTARAEFMGKGFASTDPSSNSGGL